MSYASRVTYTGDAVTKSFTVPFPYLSVSHVRVYVNEILQLNPMHYTWSGPSTIQFNTAPGIDDAIEFVRWTSPTAALVDFQDGSVLREGDLDTAYLHNFYLSQEYTDSYNNAINNILMDLATDRGIVEIETDAIINALVQDMLSQSAAANLQQRITDIDANAEAIITLGEGLQTQINTLAQGVAANVYIQADEPVPGVGGIPDPILEGSRWYDSDDNNAPYIYEGGAWVSIEDPRIGVAYAAANLNTVEMEGVQAALADETFLRATETTALGQKLDVLGSVNGDFSAFIVDLDTTKVSQTESLAERFTSLQSQLDTNAASIVTEQIARSTSDSAIAADVTALDVRVGDAEGTITTHATAIGTLEGETASIQLEYGVDLTTNGYVSGFRLINGGTPQENAFVILANKFAIVATDGPGQTEYTPMQVVGGKVQFTANVEIDGNLVVSGTINGADALSTLTGARLGSTHIGTNAIDTEHLNAGAVTANKIEAGQITATHIGVSTIAALGITTGSLSVDGTLTMGTTGKIRGGQTGYNTGTGFFLGYDSSAYKFSIGNGTDNYMTWDGTTLKVIGDILVGEYAASSNTILSATTERTKFGPNYSRKKSFTVDRAGTVRVSWQMKRNTNQGTSNGYTPTSVRCYRNSTIVSTQTNNTTTYLTKTVDVAVSAGDEIHLDLEGGTWYNSGDLALEPATGYIRNAYIQADVALTTGGSVDLN